MSAGGLSYSGLRTSAKATLPSVEMWGTNLNILKDPPKSIHTRRIDKVGQTQSILNAQDQSGDRISEMINVYARGVNPMVAVSFDNYSNNGGRSSPFQNKQAVSLPYKLQTFRPPVLRQEDLLPLSRLPRNWFYSYTNPSFPDVVQASQCNETGKSVHNTILHPNATTTKTINAVGEVPREAPSNSILNQLPSMKADTNPSALQNTYMSDDYDTGAEKKSIQTDKRSVVALTNKSSGDASRQNEFDRLSSGKIGSVFKIDVGSKKSTFMANNQQSEFTVSQDPKQIHWNKKVYEAFSQKSFNKSTNLVDNIDTNKFIHLDKPTYTANTNRSAREYFVRQDDQSAPTNSIQEPLHFSVQSTKGLLGGAQATDSSVHATAPTKTYLHKNVSSTKSFFATNDNDTTKEGGSVYEIHNQKRTPIHSMHTNTQTPYSINILPDTIPEQRRTHPLMQTSTIETDPVQIEASRDAYHIQSRDGNKKIHPTLQKGGFEGQGNAVPVFNQYERYNYAISDPLRQDLRQRTVSIMEGRYDTAPVFS